MAFLTVAFVSVWYLPRPPHSCVSLSVPVEDGPLTLIWSRFGPALSAPVWRHNLDIALLDGAGPKVP